MVTWCAAVGCGMRPVQANMCLMHFATAYAYILFERE